VPTALFIHHSIGRQLIEGGLRDALASGPEPTALWDHDYNEIGLTDPAGRRTGTSFPVPSDDTDPLGLVTLLQSLVDGGLDVPAHDLLVLKSCFPNNALDNDQDEARLREAYAEMRALASRLTAHVLLLSSPPLAVESTTTGQARRALSMAAWLAGTWPGPGLGFADLLGALSYRRGPLRGTLRTSYRARRPRDSHLSGAGARAGAAFVAGAIRTASVGSPSDGRPATGPR